MNNFDIFRIVDFMYKSHIATALLAILLIGLIFYKLKDKLFYPFPCEIRKLMFYTWSALVFEMELLAFAVIKEPYIYIQTILFFFLIYSILGVMLIFKKFDNDPIIEEYKWKIDVMIYFQTAIFLTVSASNDINIFIRLFAAIMFVFISSEGLLQVRNRRKRNDD